MVDATNLCARGDLGKRDLTPVDTIQAFKVLVPV